MITEGLHEGTFDNRTLISEGILTFIDLSIEESVEAEEDIILGDNSLVNLVDIISSN